MIKSPFHFPVSSVSSQFLICVTGTRKEEQLSSCFVCFVFQNNGKKIKYPEPLMRKKEIKKMIAVYVNNAYINKCTSLITIKN